MILLFNVNDESLVELYAHIPPSMAMLGIVLFKYSGNVWLHMLYLFREVSFAQNDIWRFGPLGFAGDWMHSRSPQHNIRLLSFYSPLASSESEF